MYMQFKINIGSKAQVWNKTAKKTSGGLTRNKLMRNKRGRIVSRRKHHLGKTKGLKRLKSLGFFTKKGQFGVFRKDGKQTKKKGRKRSRKKGRKKKTRKKPCRHKSGPKKGKYKKC
jgi:hypothetical protein